MRVLVATVKTKTGLHARLAALLVNCVSKFTSTITIKKGEQEGNLKSLLRPPQSRRRARRPDHNYG